MAKKDTLRRDATIQLVAGDALAMEFLRNGNSLAFTNRVRELAAAHDISCHLDSQGGIRTFWSWCKGHATVPSVLSDLLQECQTSQKKERRARVRFIRNMGLNSNNFNRAEYLSKIPTKVVAPLSEAYPPLGEIISETSSIFGKWDKFFRLGTQPDRRKRRLPIHRVDLSKLMYDVGPEESVIFVDATGRIVGMVIRNFCPDEDVVAWAEAIVAEAIPQRKNIRMEDPGKLIQIGYSAGARSKPHFDWVRNLLRKPADAASVIESDVKCSSVFALAWQLMRARLPEEIIGDFDKYLNTTQLKRMDGNGEMCGAPGQQRGTYSVDVGEHSFDFHNVELAPPTGVFGQNYSCATHKEKQPHTYAASWTLSRNQGVEAGCHFYLARYGIRIQAAANTLIIWIPEEEHGTSLPDVHPCDVKPMFCQRGLSFVASNRLPGVWKKYVAGLFNRAGAEAALDESDDELYA